MGKADIRRFLPIQRKLPSFLMPLIFLLSHERSGSHLLAGYLKNFGITTSDEVCNNQGKEEPFSRTQFSAFLEETAKSQTKFLYRTSAGVQRLIRDYFNHLERCFGSRSQTLVDVKYGHLHNFSSFWSMPGWTPDLIAQVTQAGHQIIHLYREDLFSTIVSNFVAHSRQLWNMAETAEQTPEAEHAQHQLTLHPKEFFRWAWALSESIRLTRWTLHFDHIDHLEIRYEEIKPGNLTDETASRIAGYLELENADKSKFIPQTKKMTAKPEQIIANYEELRSTWMQEIEPLVASEMDPTRWLTAAKRLKVI